MIGYGVILPFEEALGYYTENMGTNIKDFVIDLVNDYYINEGGKPLNNKELEEVNENITKFWFDNGQKLDFLNDKVLEVKDVVNPEKRGIIWSTDPNLHIFIGLTLNLKKLTLTLDDIKTEIDEDDINRRLIEYGFDDSKATYYFTGANKFSITKEGKQRKL